MKPSASNLFANIPDHLPNELFTNLFIQDNIQIERIVSKGHITPMGQWYDQARDEWVILLQGEASLRFEDSPDLVTLSAGDYVLIPAHVRHRVEWTLPDFNTIWLAIHLVAQDSGPA
ncbi:MAG: cupin domain-containing protein [Methylococcales bacterium]|nr:cupin domain-containing protein [Methylococcales bacterium]